jgi:hypothetical protein
MSCVDDLGVIDGLLHDSGGEIGDARDRGTFESKLARDACFLHR